MKNFYITTPVYYANAQPHIGHAYTTIAADVLTRVKKLQKQETFFLTGMDEHGAKIAQKARTENKTPQELVDEVSANFKSLWEKLEIKYDVFTRTTNPKHKKAIQKAMQKMYDKGTIYKGEYEGLYCVGCEQFKTESELVEGKCPDHNTEPEVMREESYLMKMSDKQGILIELIKKDKLKIRPEKYKKEVLSFLQKHKLEDISVSRKNVSWGIPLPFDKTHTTYVWFDAFLSYVTGLSWDGEKFLDEGKGKFWPSNINLIGKDILRVHATIWPMILMHLELPVTKGLFVHGHILSGGKKMSKTLGNVISINEMLEKFGVESTKYLLLSAGSFGNDIDITMERLIEKYNADLANGLGNLLSRVVTLINNFQFSIPDFQTQKNNHDDFVNKVLRKTENFQFNESLTIIWKLIQESNKYIEETKPWELVRSNQEKFEKVMAKLTGNLNVVSRTLQIFMPQTSQKIKRQLKTGEKEILFQRINHKK